MKHLWILLIVFNFSCSSEEDRGDLIASVYDSQLYEADVKDYLKNQQYEQQDSAKIAQAFVDHWVEDQILVHESKHNKQVDQDKIRQKVADFETDLYILELEQAMVEENLDTNITEQEIKAYYEKHQQDFQLNDYLVKVLYLKVPVDAPDIDQIGQKYKLYRETDIEEIELYAKIYASNYYYDEENWIYFDDLMKEVPLQDINKDRFIMKRSKMRFEENGFHYFLNILDFKLKNTISPLSFERKNIKERILNMRIKELRKELKNEIISNAYKEDAVQIY